jgi:hypothetical protein
MAVWADRTKILDRIDPILGANVLERLQMVHVNVPFHDLAIDISEAEFT